MKELPKTIQPNFFNREKLDIQTNAIDELVSSTQNDIRQIINILSTYRLKETNMNFDNAKQM